MDVDDARDFLVTRFGHDVGDVEAIPGGAWSHAFGFRRGGRSLIVRFSSVEGDFRNDARAGRFRSSSLPVPAVYEIGRACDGWYAISERVEGDYLEVADEATMRSRLAAVFAALDAIRTADVSDSKGFGRWRPDGDAPHATWREALLDVAADRPRILGWRRRLEARPDPARAFDAAYRALETIAPALPDARHVIHGDLLNRNVLAVGPRITAVLDWGSAMYGDFLFDLAWFVVWGPWYEGWGGLDLLSCARAHYERIGLVVPDLDLRLRACALYIVLDGLSYLAWAGLDEPLAWTTRRTNELLVRAR